MLDTTAWTGSRVFETSAHIISQSRTLFVLTIVYRESRLRSCSPPPPRTGPQNPSASSSRCRPTRWSTRLVASSGRSWGGGSGRRSPSMTHRGLARRHSASKGNRRAGERGPRGRLPAWHDRIAGRNGSLMCGGRNCVCRDLTGDSRDRGGWRSVRDTPIKRRRGMHEMPLLGCCQWRGWWCRSDVRSCFERHQRCRPAGCSSPDRRGSARGTRAPRASHGGFAASEQRGRSARLLRPWRCRSLCLAPPSRNPAPT